MLAAPEFVDLVEVEGAGRGLVVEGFRSFRLTSNSSSSSVSQSRQAGGSHQLAINSGCYQVDINLDHSGSFKYLNSIHGMNRKSNESRNEESRGARSPV